MLQSYYTGRKEEILKAKLKINQAEIKLEESKLSLRLQSLKTPIKGEILDVLVYPGEQVKANSGIIKIGDTKNMMVLAEVYETDIKDVKRGANVDISYIALEKVLKGKVVEIQKYLENGRIFSLDPMETMDKRIVIVRIKPDRPETLADFSNAQVNIKIYKP